MKFGRAPTTVRIRRCTGQALRWCRLSRGEVAALWHGQEQFPFEP